MPIGSGSSGTSRCWVPGCKNNKVPEMLKSAAKLFKFPTRDLARCREWVKVLGSEKLLSCNPDQLKNKTVCDAHFRDYEVRRNNTKTTLVTSAIPSKLPYGVGPLPDELVERWPRQKENQCGGELDSTVSALQPPVAESAPVPLKEHVSKS